VDDQLVRHGGSDRLERCNDIRRGRGASSCQAVPGENEHREQRADENKRSRTRHVDGHGTIVAARESRVGHVFVRDACQRSKGSCPYVAAIRPVGQGPPLALGHEVDELFSPGDDRPRDLGAAEVSLHAARFTCQCDKLLLGQIR
jgi:hypothetical protein